MMIELLEALHSAGMLARHVDTSNRRSQFATGTFSLGNLVHGSRNVLEVLAALISHHQARIYVPVSQNSWAFRRDALFLLLARFFRRPRIIHLHGGFFAEFHASQARGDRWLTRAALSGVDQAWVLTPTLTSQFDGLIPRSRVSVLENGVPDVHVDRSERSCACPRVLFLSNLHHDKGCFELLAALQTLADGGVSMEARFVGDADDATRQRLDALAENVSRRGIPTEILPPSTGRGRNRHLEWADVFAYPTRYIFEGQPLVLLEAMAAGLAIVSTQHRGIPDTVRQGEEGLLVPPGDVAALARALDRLATDASLRSQLARSARLRYEERYATERFRSGAIALLTES